MYYSLLILFIIFIIIYYLSLLFIIISLFILFISNYLFILFIYLFMVIYLYYLFSFFLYMLQLAYEFGCLRWAVVGGVCFLVARRETRPNGGFHTLCEERVAVRAVPSNWQALSVLVIHPEHAALMGIDKDPRLWDLGCSKFGERCSSRLSKKLRFLNFEFPIFIRLVPDSAKKKNFAVIALAGSIIGLGRWNRRLSIEEVYI